MSMRRPFSAQKEKPVSVRRLTIRFAPVFMILLAAAEGGWKWDHLLH